MAYIYRHFSDESLVFQRDDVFTCPLHGDLTRWEDLRVGLSMSLTSFQGNNNTCINEVVNPTENYAQFAVGLKYGSDQYTPNQTPMNFLGIMNLAMPSYAKFYIGNATTQPEMYFQRIASITEMPCGFIHNGYYNASTSTTAKIQFPTTAQMKLSTYYVGMFMIRFELFNRGTASQQIRISYQMDTTSAKTGALFYLFRGLKNFAADYTSNLLNYTYAGSAITIPNYFYIKWPGIRNRLRVHSLIVKPKYT